MKQAGSVFILRYTLALHFTTFIISNFSAVSQTNIDSVTKIKVAKKLFGSIDPTGENPIKKKSVVASYTSTFLSAGRKCFQLYRLKTSLYFLRKEKFTHRKIVSQKVGPFFRLIKNQGIRCQSTHFEHSRGFQEHLK